MIYLDNISLSFADRKLFNGITWTIAERSRIGLVGDNGTGKTTLLRAIIGQVELDGGEISISNRKNRTIGYLPQDLVELEPMEMMAYLKGKSGITAIENAINRYEGQLSRTSQGTETFEELLRAYESAQSRFQAKDGYAFEAKARQILKGFGFRDRDFVRNCADFSGGWKMRILLAAILLSKPDIMLLDEPINHLDTESLEWLESYLKDYSGTIIAIAHDRVFLDRIATQIAELANSRILLYKGNYSFYLREKERRIETLKKEMDLQRSEIKRIHRFVERFRYKATKASQVQSRLKTLEKFEPVQQEAVEKRVRIRFPEGPRSGREVIAARHLSKNYGDVPVFDDVDFRIYRSDRVALVGINGAGKSTLTRILNGTERPTAGTVTFGHNVKMGFFSQESAQNLDYERTIWEEINEAGTRGTDQERRNLLGAFLFSGDDIHKPISVLSGGEKSRLALLKLLLGDANTLILDEPTNHLDLKTKEIFQEALLGYHGTVLIVSHDRYFLDQLVNRVIEIREGRHYDYHGNYSYFIEKRREMLASEPLAAAPLQNAKENKATSRKTRESKRLEAEERNRLSQVRRALERELTALEEEISMLETKKSEGEQLLCDPSVHRNTEKIKALNREMAQIAGRLEKRYAEWDTLTEEMAKADAVPPSQ
ncbi:MAG: ATP-binding cassette domain-containing protein [Deltaproteobacteria bacterium]|nr:ATP-binding cassette domain-containing protein [Deltaproteobacteria bacterium]